MAEIDLQFQALACCGPDLGIEELEAVLADPFHLIHRGVRMTMQRARILSVKRIQADPDAGRNKDFA
jgi:hypothetical protein